MGIISSLEKKLILKNRIFIRTSLPRFPKNKKQLHLIFSGESALEDFYKSGNYILEDYNPDTSVLIKINLNSANKYPASTSLYMLEKLIKLLITQNVKKITVGDCSGIMHYPTRNVMRKKGLSYLGKKYRIKIVPFDYGSWVRININGEFFKNIIISDSINKYDKIINLANLKSHELARFSFSTKSLVGLMHPYQRYELHRNHLQERIAELSLAIRPDISIIDARKIFIDGGPDSGITENADTIIVNTDLLEADLEAYQLLYKIKKQNGMDDISQDPFSNVFFKHFIKINKITL